MTNNSYTIISLVYNLLVLICFFSKRRIETIENKIYGLLLKINLLNIVVALMSFLTILNDEIVPGLNNIVSKTLLVFFTMWTLLFTIYIYSISYKQKKKDKFEKAYFKFKKVIYVIFGIVVILIYTLPLYYFGENGVAYSYGPSANVVYTLTTLEILSWLVMTLSNYKNLKNKKYLPVLVFIILIIFVVAVQKINPALLLITAMETFVTIIMYFTIENPDLYMIDELYKNKNLVEQTYEDKSNFLFEITQEVRKPLFKIHNLCDELQTIKDPEELKKGFSLVNSYVKQLDFVVNDVLDVDSLDAQKLMVVNNKYSVNNLYKEIIINIKSYIPKNVEFRTKINNNVSYLYGDGIKLKQIIMSLLINSVKQTTSGFIEFNIDTIERFDACRLVVSIKSTGSNISIEEINEILSATGEIDQEDIENMNKSKMSMELCQKVIKIFGGNLMLKNNEGLGNEITLTIDQRINNNDNKLSILDQYEYYIKKSKSVLLVCQNKKYSSSIKKYLKNNNVLLSILLNPNDALDKIKAKRKYDYIILDDQLGNDSGIGLLKKMNEVDGFNTPVMVLLEQDKEKYKKHYLEDGFEEYILVNNLREDLDKIVNKY